MKNLKKSYSYIYLLFYLNYNETWSFNLENKCLRNSRNILQITLMVVSQIDK